jgi:hypothetical protein
LLSFRDWNSTQFSNFVDKNELLFPKLTKLEMRLESEEDEELIETFADNYKNSFKSFGLKV